MARAELAKRDKMRSMKEDAEKDFLAFVRMMWPVLEPEVPLIEGWLLDLLCDVLMAITDGHMTRVSINVPPGSTKSTLLNVLWPAWEWGPCNRPSLRYLSVSYSTDVPVRDNLRFARIIKHPVYQSCWGDRVKIIRDGAEWVGNDRTGFKMVTSTSGGTTGFRGDRLLLDDLNNPISVESDVVRGTTNKFIREVMPDRLNDLARSAIINLQQRTNQQDATGTLIEYGQGYQFVCVPMEFDPLRICRVEIRPGEVWSDPRSLDSNGRRLAGLTVNSRGEPAVLFGSPMAQAAGELCWPERFSEEATAKLKIEKGPYAWDCNPSEAPILMADLSMKPIGDIRVGDEIVGFETGCEPRRVGEKFARRRLVKTTVTDIHAAVRPVVKVRLDSGCTVRCTPNHKWFTGRTAKDPSHQLYASAKIGRKLMRICGTVCSQSRRERVVSIEPDGEETVYGLTTGTENYVAWGLASSNSQYQQIPGVRGGAIIRRDWWKLWPGRDYPEIGTSIISVDTSVEEKEINDWNALTAWGAFAGKTGEPLFMLLAAWRVRTNLADLVRMIADTCRERKADFLLIEHKTRGRDVSNEIRRLYQNASWETILVKPVGDKVSRLKAVSHLFSGDVRKIPDGFESDGKPKFMMNWSGGVVYAPDTDWADEVISEVAAFPYGANDDWCDTVSQALGWCRKNGVVLRKVEFDDDELERNKFRKPLGVPYAIR